MTDWTLRLARPDDAIEMPGIEARAGAMFGSVHGLTGIASQQTVPIKKLQRYISRQHCLVAHEGEKMAGFLVNEPFGRELHIWEFNVDPSVQRRGIGAGLLRACAIDAKNSGFRALTLTTFRDVPWNGPFYERMGFEEVIALDAHPRLAKELALEIENGLPADRRCAMIRLLD